MNYAIEVNNITKQFGSQFAVNDVNFNLKSGELFGLSKKDSEQRALELLEKISL